MRNYGLFPNRAVRSSRVWREAGRPVPREGRPALPLSYRLKQGRIHRLWTPIACLGAYFDACLFLTYSQMGLACGFFILSFAMFLWSWAAMVITANLEREEAEQKAAKLNMEAKVTAAVAHAVLADAEAAA